MENSFIEDGDGAIQSVPENVAIELESLDNARLNEIEADCLGWTTFDAPASKDGNVNMLVPRDRIERIPTQSLVTIKSPDERTYLASCVEGPFAEPDGLRADAPVVVTATVRGRGLALFPKFHGRATLEIMGEYRRNTVQAASLRPLPNSKIFALPLDESRRLLGTDGDLPVGIARVGQHRITVNARTTEKIGFPRHTAILGTTGAGKSTTVSGMVSRAQKNGVSSIILDVEGEYAAMYEPTDDAGMRVALDELGLRPEGAQNVRIYKLSGRETKCPDPARVESFTLDFSALSPYAVAEILDFNEAQQLRFWNAYELTKRIMREVRIYPSNSGEVANSLLVDELDQGWPNMRLGYCYDVVRFVVAKLDKSNEDPPLTTFATAHRESIKHILDSAHVEPNKFSWMTVLGRLGALLRLKIFDQSGASKLDASRMISGANISVIDLSDAESPMIRNLAIAQILKAVQQAQDEKYAKDEAAGSGHKPTLVIIEEAHEFVSSQRIKAMPILFSQLSRIAKRGRKRWLSLVFVTQLPQHLPDEVLGLVNNWVLHRISDGGVIARLRKSIGSMETSLLERASSLAPGQAILSFTTQRRALLTQILPTPCKLLMAD